MTEHCIFCRIAQGEIATERLYASDDITAFRDLRSQAPTHILVIPNRHIASLDEAREDDAALLGRMMLVAQHLAAELGLDRGYRLVLNTGAQGGQSVFHVHLHVLGGRQMQWPPG